MRGLRGWWKIVMCEVWGMRYEVCTPVLYTGPLPSYLSPSSHKCVVTVNNCCGRKQTTTRYLRTASLTWLLQEVGDVILPSCCEKLPAPVLVVVRSFLHGITHIWCLDSHIIKHTQVQGPVGSGRLWWPHSARPTDIYIRTKTSRNLSYSHYTFYNIYIYHPARPSCPWTSIQAQLHFPLHI